MVEITELAVALGQAHKDAEHLGVTLGGQHRVVGHKARGIQLRALRQVALQQCGAQRGRHIATGVFQQRHQVIGRRAL
ncbi:hypothetical protein D3C85_1609300 [compost metagenome]